MKQRFFLLASALCIVFVSVLFAGSYAHADEYGLSATAGAAGLSQNKNIPGIIGNVVGAGLSLVSVLFFILMIYGGIRWMLARGKEEEAKKALDTIVAAIIGIIIVLAAYAITNFVFKSVGDQAPTPEDDPQDEQASMMCQVSGATLGECKAHVAKVPCDDAEKCEWLTSISDPKKACLPKGILSCKDLKETACLAAKDKLGCEWVAKK